MSQQDVVVYHNERMRYAYCMILTVPRHFFLLGSIGLIILAIFVLIEILLFQVLGFPDFPGGLCGIFCSCCLMVLFSYRLFAFVPTSWIPFFANIWSASKTAYDRVRSAGNKAWTYVLGIEAWAVATLLAWYIYYTVLLDSFLITVGTRWNQNSE